MGWISLLNDSKSVVCHPRLTLSHFSGDAHASQNAIYNSAHRCFILVLLAVLCLTTNAQNVTSTKPFETSVDSFYIVQFVALKDTNRQFQELEHLGKVIKEFLPDRGICRYNLGYYFNRAQAQNIVRQVRLAGFSDAFIRKSSTGLLLPSEILRSQKPIADSTLLSIGEIDIVIREKAKVPKMKAGELLDDPDLSTDQGRDEEGITPTITPKTIFSILYTGKSLGVLGNTRFQSEHELVTEYAIENDIKFKLVSHACWRTKGLTIFLPSDEPIGHELNLILKERKNWEVLESYPALRTNNVVLFRDPDRTDYDMLDIVLKNKRTQQAFPEIEKIQVRIYRALIEEDTECFIVEEPGALWPQNQKQWSAGEINRVDFGKKGRLFELPSNQGNFDSRVKVLASLVDEASDEHTKVLKIDLGHRNGDFGLSARQRALVDMQGLDSLGYDILVPYEFELSLGAEYLAQLRKNTGLKWLATNLTSSDSSLFAPYEIIEFQGVRLGLIGMVEPSFATNLSGKILKSFRFENTIDAAQKAVEKLLKEEVDAVVALSNMSSDQNAILAERVYGIDVLSSDISNNGTPFNFTKEIQLPLVEKRGYGRPYHIANNYDYGIAVGKVDLEFSQDTMQENASLSKITEQNFPVNDRIESDTSLVHQITKNLDFAARKKGDLMFPAFIDIIEQRPSLETYDKTTKNGRMSKGLWEKFIANVLRRGAPAEVSLVRPVTSFLPLIGKLHEREVRSWLWMEDEIVLMDMKGRDIRRLFEADKVHDLVTSGVMSFDTPRRRYWFVNGRFMHEDVYYSVATTNVITNGPLKEHFRWAFKVNDRFVLHENGRMKRSKDGQPVALRKFMIREMKQIRSMGKGKDHHKRIAEILSPSTRREKLFTLNFVKPTLWSSLNRNYKGDGYEAVPESRVIASSSFIIGADGGLVLTMDKQKFAWDLGTRMAFAEQSADVGLDEYQKTETMDDLNVYLTYRYKGEKRKALHPFLRFEYDSEFTPTFNTSTGMNNPRQQILRTTLGLSKQFSLKWPVVEFGFTAENDFSNNHYQYGFQGRSRGRFPLDKNWHVMYLLTNNFNYFFPTANDTDRELSFKYNMIHEILIPLLGNVSLNVGADFFFFKGKTAVNSEPGLSMLMRVGITYNRR